MRRGVSDKNKKAFLGIHSRIDAFYRCEVGGLRKIKSPGENTTFKREIIYKLCPQKISKNGNSEKKGRGMQSRERELISVGNGSQGKIFASGRSVHVGGRMVGDKLFQMFIVLPDGFQGLVQISECTEQVLSMAKSHVSEGS